MGAVMEADISDQFLFFDGCSAKPNILLRGCLEALHQILEQEKDTLLIILILLLLFGGGGGYYAYNTYSGTGLGGVVGTVLVIFLILWLLGLVR